jgi:putative ABC transport system permease protein
LGRLLPESLREPVLGDLAERYRLRPAGAGTGIWYLRESLGAVLAVRWHGLESRLDGFGRVRGGAGFPGDVAWDTRLAIRGLIRGPGFALIAVVTLALGMGATSAIYSVAKPVLFSPLPYRAPERLVMVWEKEASGADSNTGFATFADVRRDARTLESVAAIGYWSVTVTGDGRPERLVGQRVSAGFFPLLGVEPEVGRAFLPEEDSPTARAVVILGHALWKRRFGGDPSVVGRAVTLSGDSYEVVGVLPADFESLLAPEAQVWRPLRYDVSQSWACRTCRHLRAIARLAPGVSLVEAEQELDALSARYVAAHPTEYEVAGMRLEPLREQVVKQARPALRLVLGAAALVLLIACANVANLLFARAVRRAPEFAVRSALGAGRWRIARQMLIESVVLGIAGGVAGLLVALWSVRVLVTFAPPELPRLGVVGVDGGVLLFAGLVAVGGGLLFGVLPAAIAGRTDLLQRMGAGRRVAGARRRRALRAGLVVSEVALALALTAGAGLLVRSLDRLFAVDAGFDPADLLTMELQAAGPEYDDDATVVAMEARLLDAVLAIPGVESAGLVSQLPLGGNFDRWGVRIEDRPLANPSQAPGADRYSISPGYIRAMRIPVLSGRAITEADREGALPVVLINETFAERYWPGEDPIGARVHLGAEDSPWRTIVGVVGDVRHTALDAPLAPQIYLPIRQSPWADTQIALAVRSDGDPGSFADPVRRAVWSADADLAITRVLPAPRLVRASAARRDFALRIFAAFAIVALLLAGAGIFGVLSGVVAERTREIGVRTALGATRANVLGLVVGQGMRIAGLGLVLGVAIALGCARLLRGLLFGVQPDDPATLAAVSAILALVALIACAVPALRAARTDPVRTLRTD